MGAWGFDALDSDQALDWLGMHVTDQVGAEVVKVLERFEDMARSSIYEACDRWGHELRAASHVVISLNFFSDRLFGDLHARCAEALERLEACDEWINDWSKPASARTSIRAQIDALREGQQPTTMFENAGA